MSDKTKYHKVLVEEFTTPTPITVESTANIKEIVAIMREHGVRHVPIVDNGKALGIISDRDIKLIGRFDGWMEFNVSDVMSPDPYMVNPEATLDEVAFHMSKYKMGSALRSEEHTSELQSR